MTDHELSLLDLAVAQSEEINPRMATYKGVPTCVVGPGEMAIPYRPSRNRGQAMQLLEKYGISLERVEIEGPVWAAQVWRDGLIDKTGPNPCIAICRAVEALNQHGPTQR